ncbi:hypothetical protein BOTBODRAFT_122686, partial [Botryobasidium botryosum FD-172 SS1]
MSFLEQKGLYLKELLVLEGAEGVATSCRCGSEELALLRCFECHPTDVFCKPCALRRHRHHPFHRVQMWDTSAGYFAPVNLVELGFVYQLMHPDSPCVDTPLGRQPSPPKLQNKRGGDVVLVAHTNGFHRISFSYCRCPGCPSHAAQLIRSRIFPGSPHARPESAYTIPMLDFGIALNLECAVNPYNYYNTLMRCTYDDLRGDASNRYDNFRVVFRLWRELRATLMCGATLGLPNKLPAHFQDPYAVLCPSCPLPGINFSEDDAKNSTIKEYLKMLELSVDGNFRLQLKKKSEEPTDFHLHDGRGYFVPSKEYQEYIDTVVFEPETSTCHGFKAGDILREGKFKDVIVSGMVSVVCSRHGFFLPQGSVDLQKGERYAN